MTCIKQSVYCLLLDKNNQVISVGSNWCEEPQERCPREDRGLKTGVGYAMCSIICKQNAHAEIDAFNHLKENDAPRTCILIGHYYCCQGCLEALRERGIENIVIIKELVIK